MGSKFPNFKEGEFKINLIIITQARFFLNRKGEVVHETGTRGYSFWKRYIENFEKVVVLGRLTKEHNLKKFELVEGEKVKFQALPTYNSLFSFVRNRKKFDRIINEYICSNSVFLLRLPSPIANRAFKIINKNNRIFGVELVGDPWDSYSKRSVTHPLRPLLRVILTWQTKKVVKTSDSVSYVTRYYLQKKYPPQKGAFITNYSSIDLKEEDIAEKPREFKKGKSTYKIVHVGSMDQWQKGQDILLKALKICEKRGLDFKLNLVGGGRYKSRILEEIKKLDLHEKVNLIGTIPSGDPIKKELDKADIFVFPSRVEGLPRALIEAMARGLPCIATNVGGIPELLPSKYLVRTESPSELAGRIEFIVENPALMEEMSCENLEKSKEYSETILKEKRRKFYKRLREIGERSL